MCARTHLCVGETISLLETQDYYLFVLCNGRYEFERTSRGLVCARTAEHVSLQMVLTPPVLLACTQTCIVSNQTTSLALNESVRSDRSSLQAVGQLGSARATTARRDGQETRSTHVKQEQRSLTLLLILCGESVHQARAQRSRPRRVLLVELLEISRCFTIINVYSCRRTYVALQL